MYGEMFVKVKDVKTSFWVPLVHSSDCKRSKSPKRPIGIRNWKVEMTVDLVGKTMSMVGLTGGLVELSGFSIFIDLLQQR